MSDLQLFLIVSGIALGLALGLLWYLRRQNPFVRIPVWRVGLFFVYGAVFAPAALLTPTTLLHLIRFEAETVLGAFLWIGPSEELVKALGPIVIVGLVRRWREEPYEWMLACAASGVGFAMTENILYAMSAPGAFEVLALRSVALMHLSWSAFIGFWIGCRRPGAWRFITAAVGAWLIAAFLHGFYDAMCFQGIGPMVGLLIGLYLFGFLWRIRKMSWLCANRSPRRPDLQADWQAATRVASRTISCTSCARPFESIPLRGIEVACCSCCGRATVGRHDLFRLISEYAGTSGWFKADAWHQFYWKEAPEPSTCATCNKASPTRAFLEEDGPLVGFCDECAMATAPRDVIARLIHDYRERIQLGFKARGEPTDL